MKNGTSLYLDLVRFSAAMLVFLEHFREHTRNSFAPFWQSHGFWYSHSYYFSQTAVMVFFVLSGYVIAHVLSTRETTPLEYGASRFARLYSVVLPALILTMVCNHFVQLKYLNAFNAFQEFDSLSGSEVAFHYLGTALFVNHFWLWQDLEPPDADPFWSLSFEASYYVGIALLLFARGRIRLCGLFLLCAVAGPTMVLLAPTWLVGYWAYHISQRRQLPAGAAIAIWLTSTFLLLMCPLIELHLRVPLTFLRMPDRTYGELFGAYAAAACFSVNIVTFDRFSESVEFCLQPFLKLIRWLGSLTFALYLFHQPLLSLFTVYTAGERSSSHRMMWIIGGTLLIVATLGRACEQAKGAYKRQFLLVWERAVALRGRFPRTP